MDATVFCASEATQASEGKEDAVVRLYTVKCFKGGCDAFLVGRIFRVGGYWKDVEAMTGFADCPIPELGG